MVEDTVLIKRKVFNFSISNLFYNLFILVLGILILFLIIVVKSKTAADFQSEPILYLYTVFITVFQLSRVGAAILYNRSMTRIERQNMGIKYEPFVSFVIPCKNEEKSIGKTVEKCFEADYPKEKLEVIVINDGSTDGTLNVLKKAQAIFPSLIIIDWKVNKGKRHGMAAGFRASKGDVVVQLDSDSYIKPNTFRSIIDLFKIPDIGSVCAHTDPENPDENLLTKMQTAYYFMSFRILKAAESTFLTVFCCSGCASAYRKNIVMPILDDWLEEKFLGAPVTWGDDRALTNRVLKEGYKAIYSDRVKAYTIIPNNLKQLLKQQVRWKKGWFVNSLFASRFILKKDTFVAITYFFPLIFLTLITPFMAIKAFVYNPIFKGLLPFYYILGVLLVAGIITVYYRFIDRENKYWPYMFLWAILNMFVLSFILLYALTRLRDRAWGTR